VMVPGLRRGIHHPTGLISQAPRTRSGLVGGRKIAHPPLATQTGLNDETFEFIHDYQFMSSKIFFMGGIAGAMAGVKSQRAVRLRNSKEVVSEPSGHRMRPREGSAGASERRQRPL
jgi:hypothetical protein